MRTDDLWTFADMFGIKYLPDEKNQKQEHVDYMKNVALSHGFDSQHFSLYQLGFILDKKEFLFKSQGFYVTEDVRKEIKYTVVEEDEKELLKPYALMLACLQGNSFPGFIEQYMKDAKYFLVENGWWEMIKSGTAMESITFGSHDE